MEKQVTSTPPPIPGNGGGGSGYLYLHYLPPVDREPAINVDMVNYDTVGGRERETIGKIEISNKERKKK